MSTVEEAKNAIKAIGDDWGYIPDELLEGLDEARKREIQRLVRNKDDKISAMITTLAQQLYGSGARFVFELLQNADDNRYERIKAQGELPYISFSVHPDRIVTECNEDGFTSANLKSICSVGQSTKAASYGYIGAKGIGFKSVFIAASKVYIQSGHYSFYFEHDKGDPGVGMAIPKWKDSEEQLEGPLTRMVLWLRRKGNPEELQQLRNTIFQQLNDLQQTSLLFLRKLKRISVAFYDENGNLERSRTIQVSSIDSSTFVIEVATTDEEGRSSSREGRYHVTKHMATGLTRSGDRTDLETEESKRASSSAEVILAFPLTSEGAPHIESHQVFAFLPTKDKRYNFIIQSDFQTTASREDVVTDSRRNVDLLDAIAVAFVKAVQEFCKRPALRFTWPRYLPSTDGGANSFWSSLNAKIKDQMVHSPILQSRHKTELRKMSEICAIPPDFVDENGEPLVDDTTKDPFISPDYEQEVINDILRKYGLPNMHFALCLDLLRLDLRSSSSKIKSKKTTEHWHSVLAKLLTRAVGNPDNLSQVKSMALLPLMNDQWTASNQGTVYLPTTGGINVPYVTSLLLLDPSAVRNNHRRELFIKLGAKEPSVDQVRAEILASYTEKKNLFGSSYTPKIPDRSSSRAHLRYLYLTHRIPKHTEELRNIPVYVADALVLKPFDNDIYIPSGDDILGPTKLLGSTGDAPAHEVTFLHPDYLVDVPEKPSPGHVSWDRWCVDCLGLRNRLRLVTKDGKDLSEAWFYVVEHKPKQLLALLKHLWKFEGDNLSGQLREKIEDTQADNLCVDSGFAASCYIWQTYLPLPHLRAHRDRFMISPSEKFPFLYLPRRVGKDNKPGSGKDEGEKDNHSEWMFLHYNFSVGIEDNINFFMNLVYWTQSADWTEDSEQEDEAGQKGKKSEGGALRGNHHRLLQLYVAIQGKCVGAVDQKAAREDIGKFFQAQSLIYLPPESAWVAPDDCLWEAPPNLTNKHSLKHIYYTDLAEKGDELRYLVDFFRETLLVPDATWKDLTEELEALRDVGCEDFEGRIFGVYVYLNGLIKDPVAPDMRAEFAKEKLIFVTGKNGKGSWHTIDECLWSSNTEIRGKVTLSELYEDLEYFFTECLGVQKLNLQMVYDDLLHVTQDQNIDLVKSKIGALSSLLQSESQVLDHKPMLDVPIFPVKNLDGSTTLEKAAVEFAIADRDYLEVAFHGKLKLLDYSLADVISLQPFLKWVALTDRLLSTSIKEITSVNDNDARPVTKRNRDISRKSYALLRIAATCKSPRYTTDAAGLYETLRSLRTIQTDSITSVLSASQDGKKIEVPKEAGDIRISEEDTSLTIYVPMKRRKQEYCFASRLPTKLEDWFLRDPETQERQAPINNSIIAAISAVFSVRAAYPKDILDDKGIIQISIEQNTEDLKFDDEDSSSDESDGESTAPRQLMSPISMSSGGGGGGGHYQSSSYSRYSTPTPYVDTQYLNLLKKVVSAARVASFPYRGSLGLSSLQDALPSSANATVQTPDFHAPNDFYTTRSESRMERDRKLGVAGELYVFELLSRLNLPSWSRQNWTSSLRKLAALHPEYADLRAYNDGRGVETSDLVYDDTESILTEFLAENGYLDEDWWERTPRYWLEVKTTAGACETTWFMSKKQFGKMKEVNERRDYREVYVVFRVFGIEGERVGLKVYVDPEEMRRSGELVFKEETWGVTEW